MTGRTLRLRRLEDLARQAAAGREDLNAGRVRAALGLLSDADLEALEGAVIAAGGVGLPVRPWADLPPGLPEDHARAWGWAAHMDRLTGAHPWPMPPAAAPAVFEAQAAKVEGLGQEDAWARVAWVLYAALARVILEEQGDL
ncbi:hypothetical protein [Deinococcus apachensis]|uniref:hypothetical protein n=1 Tax=Deinococcus apachensis TaxID=309886 RepID=UPI00036C7A6C|nr:hypothetical protein [Deinococcus apachensis]